MFRLRLSYINERLMTAGSAYIGLALPGEAGSWQMENKVNSPIS